MFSLQLYSGNSKENIDQNRVNTMPEDLDTAYEQYKQEKAQKHFRIDTLKYFTSSPNLENAKLSARQSSFKLTKAPQNPLKSMKEMKSLGLVPTFEDFKKKPVFSIKPKALDAAKTIYSANSSPFNLKKSFKIAPSPGATTKKRFFINPQPIKSRILDF